MSDTRPLAVFDSGVGGLTVLRALVGELMAYPGVAEAMSAQPSTLESQPVMPLEIREGDLILRWFSAIATFGTPTDLSVEGLRIETLFPADKATEIAVRRHAQARARSG